MTKIEIQNEIKALQKSLIIMLEEGQKLGEKHSVAYECGYHIGTIKSTIEVLKSLIIEKI
jgi:hypothetical protein